MWMELDRFVHTLKPSEQAVIHRPASLSSVVHERGWPLNLLLPRGRREGMLFRFMVIITHAERDAVNGEDVTSHELGYPLNRPMPPGQRIADLVTHSHIATRNIWINHISP